MVLSFTCWTAEGEAVCCRSCCRQLQSPRVSLAQAGVRRRWQGRGLKLAPDTQSVEEALRQRPRRLVPGLAKLKLAGQVSRAMRLLAVRELRA